MTTFVASQALTHENQKQKLEAKDWPELNYLLQGGLAFGQLVEWGAPLGWGGREVVLDFIVAATQGDLWCLWVHHQPGLSVYPPAWAARGVAMDKIRFAESSKPLQDLRALFLDPFFKIIVIDNPEKLSADDCAFIAHHARRHQRLVLLLRNQNLNAQQGNVWSKVRLNAWQDEWQQKKFVSVVRGFPPQQVSRAIA